MVFAIEGKLRHLAAAVNSALAVLVSIARSSVLQLSQYPDLTSSLRDIGGAWVTIFSSLRGWAR
jgi:hypothetical protein